MDIRYTDHAREVDEDAYLRDFVRAVEHRNIAYVTFVVPIIQSQKTEVLTSQCRYGTSGSYFDLATEDSSRYDLILSHGLIVAANCGDIAIVKYLVERGININARNADGDTALIKACERGHTDVTKYLLSRPDLDINVTNMAGSSALHSAAKFSGRWQIVDALLSAPQIDVDSTAHKRGKSALHAAAEQDPSGRNAHLLLDRGAFVNVLDLDGRTPLHDAASRGLVANVSLLLRYGAHPNIADQKLGVTALHEAAKNGHSAVVIQLVTAGADPDIRNKCHVTALDECETQAKLRGDGEGSFDSIREFLLEEAEHILLSEKHRILRVFEELCTRISANDNWQQFFLELYAGDERRMQDVMGQVPCQVCETSLTVIIHFLLHRWLADSPERATFWVLMRALRDYGMSRIADQMTAVFAS